MDNASINRFKTNKNNLYKGKVDEEGNIKIGQIDKSKIRETGKKVKYVRFGEFKTNIKSEDWKNLPDDYKININELKYFRPILSGDIKIREGATPISKLW